MCNPFFVRFVFHYDRSLPAGENKGKSSFFAFPGAERRYFEVRFARAQKSLASLIEPAYYASGRRVRVRAFYRSPSLRQLDDCSDGCVIRAHLYMHTTCQAAHGHARARMCGVCKWPCKMRSNCSNLDSAGEV